MLNLGLGQGERPRVILQAYSYSSKIKMPKSNPTDGWVTVTKTLTGPHNQNRIVGGLQLKELPEGPNT